MLHKFGSLNFNQKPEKTSLIIIVLWSIILVFMVISGCSEKWSEIYTQLPGREAADAQADWQRTFGGGSGEYGHSVQQTKDGGYIFAGETYSFSFAIAGPFFYLVKTDASGNMQWQKAFISGSLERGFLELESGRSVQQTEDGGYIIAGDIDESSQNPFQFRPSMSDVKLIKTDASGNMQWQKELGGSWNDAGYSVQQTKDGGYIITGYADSWYADSFGAGNAVAVDRFGHDVYLVKTDASGDMQWQKTFGGSSDDWGFSVQQTKDGGYIIAGLTNSFGAVSWDPNCDVYLVKTDASGDMQWQKTFGGADYDAGSSVQQTKDGGYIITGFTTSFGAGSWDVYLIKTDASGDMQWQKTFGGANIDESYSVQQTKDGGYIITGYTTSFGAGGCDVYLIKTDASGDMQWQKTFGGSSDDYGRSVQQTEDGSYIIAGDTDSFGRDTDSFGGVRRQVYLIKTKGDSLP